MFKELGRSVTVFFNAMCVCKWVCLFLLNKYCNIVCFYLWQGSTLSNPVITNQEVDTRRFCINLLLFFPSFSLHICLPKIIACNSLHEQYQGFSYLIYIYHNFLAPVWMTTNVSFLWVMNTFFRHSTLVFHWSGHFIPTSANPRCYNKGSWWIRIIYIYTN